MRSEITTHQMALQLAGAIVDNWHDRAIEFYRYYGIICEIIGAIDALGGLPPRALHRDVLLIALKGLPGALAKALTEIDGVNRSVKVDISELRRQCLLRIEAMNEANADGGDALRTVVATEGGKFAQRNLVDLEQVRTGGRPSKDEERAEIAMQLASIRRDRWDGKRGPNAVAEIHALLHYYRELKAHGSMSRIQENALNSLAKQSLKKSAPRTWVGNLETDFPDIFSL